MSGQLDQYQIFLYAAKYRSMSEAAKKLFTTQSSVTRQIQALENRLGLPLFVRSGQGLTLTSEGEYLFRQLSPAFDQIHEAEKMISDLRSLSVGSVRIAVNNLAAEWIVLKLKHLFVARYPGVSVTVSTVDMADILSVLTSGYMDMAVLLEYENGDYYFTDNKIRHLDIRRNFYGQYTDRFFVGPSYRNFAEKERKIEEFRPLPLIAPFNKYNVTEYYLNALRDGGFAEGDYPVDGPMHRLKLIELDRGVSFLPDYFVRSERESGKILRCETDFPMYSSVLYSLQRNHPPLTRAAGMFSELLMQPVF